QIQSMHSKVQERKITINNEDKYLQNEIFNSEYESTQLFFVWKSETYSQEISTLLSGDAVTIKADIAKSYHDDKNTIKFNKIGIKFKVKQDETKQSELDNKLKYFDVKITHLGNSYYKYNNKFYVMANEEYDIDYSFEKDNYGQTLRYNEVYKKLRKGN
ncbi:7512_t:CDS:1, partial [Racocetra persica]